MKEVAIWKPVAFDPAWLELNTEQIDQVLPAWFEKRASIKDDNDEMKEFFERIKRRQAIETGIVEGLYTLSRGATETFIMQGFAEDYLQHGDTNVPDEQLMGHLRDQYEALDWVFDFIKSDRQLSVAFIKELHALVTRHQETASGIVNGRKVPIPLIHGAFKKWPNNPRSKDGALVLYCPPEQVDSEMDAFISVYANEMKDAHIVIRAAWTHFTFVQIHPFQDGNGRIARLLTSLVLIQGGLFPFALERSQRPQYIGALEAADDGSYQPLLDMLMADQLDSMGPEVLAKALAVQFGNTAHGQKLRTLEQRRNEILKYTDAAVRKEKLGLEKPLRAIGKVLLKSSQDGFFLHIQPANKQTYSLRFYSEIERDMLRLRFQLQLNWKDVSSETLPINTEKDDHDTQFLVSEFVRKKISQALQIIMQSL